MKQQHQQQQHSRRSRPNRQMRALVLGCVLFCSSPSSTSTSSSSSCCHAFTPSPISLPLHQQQQHSNIVSSLHASPQKDQNHVSSSSSLWKHATNLLSGIALGGFLTASVAFAGPVWAENELSDRYGGAGIDTSLVDQNCLIDKCSLQAKACLADDANCRKGLTCTAKCLGDNSCITGCMARYGNEHLDGFLKCTIEDNECIKIAILEGGADPYGQEPPAPGPTLVNFDHNSLQGQWFKVLGYNPNYDCYACQRNSFAPGTDSNKLAMNVEFSMPHLLPDGSPPPPSGSKEMISFVSSSTNNNNNDFLGPQSIGLNAYHTTETMVFDTTSAQNTALTWDKEGSAKQGVTYARTAHSEGEMFGLKFWENWYILGENDPDTPEFKFVYYNGKTRQNTYEGAFVYSRTRELPPESMAKVYQIAQDAGMNTKQFCKIRNQGCFAEEEPGTSNSNNMIPEPSATISPAGGGMINLVKNSNTNYENYPAWWLYSPQNPFRGIVGSTKVSEILGVEPVEARDMVRQDAPTAPILHPVDDARSSDSVAPVAGTPAVNYKRAWWFEVGDYLENPHRHFQTMEKLRIPMDWPENIVAAAQQETMNSQ